MSELTERTQPELYQMLVFDKFTHIYCCAIFYWG